MRLKIATVDLEVIEDLYDEHGLISNLPAIARNYYNNMPGPDRRDKIGKHTPPSSMSLIASVWRDAAIKKQDMMMTDS